MSEFKVEVVKVGPVEKHPNADSLGITKVYDYPVIVKLGEVNEGDVIRPLAETWDHKVGRLILKYITEDYLLRKGGTEHH